MTKSVDILTAVMPITMLSADEIQALVAVPPEQAAALVRCLYRECKSAPNAQRVLRQVFDSAQRSGRSISESFADIIVVYQWLEARGATASSHDVIEYVSCAYEGSSLQMGHNIDWYLDTYGFEMGVTAKPPI